MAFGRIRFVMGAVAAEAVDATAAAAAEAA
jgi:hypothetical protein